MARLVCCGLCVALCVGEMGCGGSSGGSSGSSGERKVAFSRAVWPPDQIVLITIDTLRADRVGAYGWQKARTPAIDALAANGARFQRAYATAPITLVSHASLLTGLYPQGHGSRHNGMRVHPDVHTLATVLHGHGFNTAAFIAAYPLDHRFGLDSGFDVYNDGLGRAADGRPRNERPGREVIDAALDWIAKREALSRYFLWVHLFEPHAPYEGDPVRPASDRYDDEIAKADAQVARLVQAVQARHKTRASWLIVVAGDHGEAFGEHGEIGHSLFVYDTTLRVPLIFAGGLVGTRTIDDAVSLVDVMPTILDLAHLPAEQTDGASLAPYWTYGSGTLPPRALYAESFAPLYDFGWSPLQSLRLPSVKYIAAPKPELYDITSDAGETHNLYAERPDIASKAAMQLHRQHAERVGLEPQIKQDPAMLARLRSLGYLASTAGAPANFGTLHPDPKDRVELASRIAEVTSGELQGPALRAALERLVREDPRNGQMQMRLGFVLQEAGECGAAMPHFQAATAAALPSADPYLGLAECQMAAGQRDAARRALITADRVEPGNPVVAANLGAIALDEGKVPDAIARLRAALATAPDLHIARFNLARAYGRAGQRADAAREARELLARLPPDAPQRPEVERLLAAVQ